MHRGLPLLVGLKSVKLRSSELGSGLAISLGDVSLVFRNILRRLLGDLVGTICGSSRIYMQSNITFKCAYKTILIHNKLAI
jgi:hypothetical protein